MKKCSYCGNSNFDNAAYCENCGMPLKEGIRISCPRCGKNVRENEKFCRYCGASLLASIPCPRCGHQVLSTDVFCAECGYQVTDADRKAAARIAAELHQKNKEVPAKKEEIKSVKSDIDELEDVAEQILYGAQEEEVESPQTSDLEDLPASAEKLQPAESLNVSEELQDSSLSDSLMEEDVIDEEIGEEHMDEEIVEEVVSSSLSSEAQHVAEEAPSPENEADQIINEALMDGGQLMAEEQFQEAVKTFSKAIGAAIKNGLEQQEDRRLISLYLKRGEAFLHMRDFERTNDNYSRALKYAQSIFAAQDVERIRELMANLP